MLNKITIMGRITAEPELKTSVTGTKFCKFSIAVKREFKNKDGIYDTDFFDVIVWNKLAEKFAEYFSKGQRILMTGVLENNNYVDKDDVAHYGIQIRMDSMNIIEPRIPQKSAEISELPVANSYGMEYEIPYNEDDIPF